MLDVGYPRRISRRRASGLFVAAGAEILLVACGTVRLPYSNRATPTAGPTYTPAEAAEIPNNWPISDVIIGAPPSVVIGSVRQDPKSRYPMIDEISLYAPTEAQVVFIKMRFSSQDYKPQREVIKRLITFQTIDDLDVPESVDINRVPPMPFNRVKGDPQNDWYEANEVRIKNEMGNGTSDKETDTFVISRVRTPDNANGMLAVEPGRWGGLNQGPIIIGRIIRFVPKPNEPAAS